MLAEDAVRREPLSAQIPVNREIYREFSQIRPQIPGCESAIALEMHIINVGIQLSR
jgi:hypothetical protein